MPAHRTPSIVPGPVVMGTPVRADLGWHALRHEWRAMFSREHLLADLRAGLAVGLVAVPLTVAIAIASDVPPGLGLLGAAVGGLLCALFGGSRIAVGGPAAALAVLVGQIVDAHGLEGLALAALIAGSLQLITGLLGQARWMRVVPISVVHGFTAGIGILLLVGQLPRVLGLPAPDESHALDVAVHVGNYLHRAHPTASAVGAFALLTTLALTRLAPKAPAAFLAVLMPALLVYALGWNESDVPLLGAITPWPSLPALGAVPPGALPRLLVEGLVLYAVSSLESVITTDAVQRERPEEPTPDPD